MKKEKQEIERLGVLYRIRTDDPDADIKLATTLDQRGFTLRSNPRYIFDRRFYLVGEYEQDERGIDIIAKSDDLIAALDKLISEGERK